MATLARTVALVSGGASGLGAATARHLIQQGARVMVADLNMTSERVQPLRDWAVSQNIRLLDESDTLSSCYAQGPCLAFCPTNVTKSDEVNHALNQLERVFGEPLNAAVSCAGIAIAQKTLSKKGPHDLDDFIETMMVNTVGSFNVSRLAAARMQEREPDRDGLRGCIVNTASIAAFEGQIGQVAYSASKGGIVGMTLPMARELSRYGIRVMTIVSPRNEMKSATIHSLTIYNERLLVCSKHHSCQGCRRVLGKNWVTLFLALVDSVILMSLGLS
jgi:3-hydroxyacyl-CoA dehydrogenase/3-hydroxy-2-methylbutyryl-CoA dehydrogenase